HRLLREDPERARELVGRCGGLPLALRLAGADLDLAGLLHRLDTAPRLPEELDRIGEGGEAEARRPRVPEVIAFGWRISELTRPPGCARQGPVATGGVGTCDAWAARSVSPVAACCQRGRSSASRR